MGRIGSAILNTNDMFPDMDLQVVSGETIKLPGGIGGDYSVVLFYRGHWWPFCNRQLADFQALLQEFESEQIMIIAASTDPREKARETVEKLAINYPIGYGMDVEEASRLTGAFYEEERKFIHATGFIIRPDNTIEVAAYSTGPIGRFMAKDVLGLVKFYKSKAKK